MGQGDSASVLTRAKVWKMREYWMYFPFFILHDWGKRSAEARNSHLSGVSLIRCTSISLFGQGQWRGEYSWRIMGYPPFGKGI